MSIFDRLKRLARSEISEMKRVLSERDDDLPGDPLAEHARDETERQRLIREAEDELARAEHDVLAAEIDAGAALWGNAGAPFSGTYPSGAPAPGITGTDIERGAALWGAPDAEVVNAPGPNPAPPTPNAAPNASTPPPPYESRTHAFPREVRDAYAALELPLGADRPTVDQSFRELLHRYHPDKHVGDPRREAMANDLTIRIREARDVLVAWLARPA